MDADRKKLEEREIFDLVYGDTRFDEVKAHENPDFLVRRFATSAHFGVEVTNYYLTQTNARLDRIDGYRSQLWDGADFKHKDDAKNIDVSKVDVIRSDDTIHAKDIPAIVQHVPRPQECARDVAGCIKSKGDRARASTAQVAHANLIIQDRSRLLHTVKVQDFYRMYFVPKLIDVISSSPFREVFLVTSLERRHVYVRLKTLHLLAEAFHFNSALSGSGHWDNLPPHVDDTELFASYFRDTANAPVQVHRDSMGIEVIFGDSGIIVSPDRSVTVRLHADTPISPDAYEPSLDWRSLLGEGFHEKVVAHRENHVFSSDAVFDVNKSVA